MEKRRMVRALICFAGLLLLAGLLFCLSLTTGSSRIAPETVFGILTGRAPDAAASRIIMDIRLPRTLSALILGGGLSVSGFLLQSFFRNPIAGPFVLGISSGAKLTVALLMIAALQHGFVMRSGVSGENKEHKHLIEYSLKLDSNPEFTTNVLVAFARAAARFAKEQSYGCKTVFDVPPAYLSPLPGEELRAHLL